MKHNIKAQQGLLSPGGKLYKCDWAQHLELAIEILKNNYNSEYKEKYDYEYQPQDILSKLGWIVLTNPPHYMGYAWFPQIELTQAQINTIFDWEEANDSFVPMWILEQLKQKV